MAKFKLLTAQYGVFVEYARDRAGRDLGLHLTQPSQSKNGQIVTPALIWFQMKGVMTGTLSREAYDRADEVTLVLETAHLVFWYMNVQPTYLVVYVESADRFLAIDIKEWVHREFGEAILTRVEKSTSVRVHKRNVVDDDFFRLVLHKNLVPSLRNMFSREDDRSIARFLRDSSLVKWVVECRSRGAPCRVRIIKYMSKLRTEAHFESCETNQEWVGFRAHWQFMMGDIAAAFPFLQMSPERRAVMERTVGLVDDFDGAEREVWTEHIKLVDDDSDDWWDDGEAIDYECLLQLGDDEYSYGDMGGGEVIEHRLAIDLNEIGERWAETLKVLEQAEVISVGLEPHLISVAPWHARDI